jgi:integrase
MSLAPVPQGSPCTIEPPRALTWADVENEGRVAFYPDRGWCVEFRAVRWPGRSKPRRVRITKAPGYGKLETEREATKVHLQIQAELLRERPLHEVLSAYLDEIPEDAVLHRYREEFLPEQRAKHAAEELSKERLGEFEGYLRRGHLAFWENVQLNDVTGPMLKRWISWLRQQGKLKTGGMRHVVNDFGAFLRYQHSIGSLRILPVIPTIAYTEEDKVVPRMADARRVLDAIPDEIRGLWLAHTLAGLRPAEARRLDVGDYDFETGELAIPPSKCKTKRGRCLPIREVVPELDGWIVRHRSNAMRGAPLFRNPGAYKKSAERWKEHAERNVWLAACDAAGVEYVEPNAAGRHAFATHEINEEATDKLAVRDWLGHTSLATTERYGRVRSSALARRMRKLQDAAREKKTAGS